MMFIIRNSRRANDKTLSMIDGWFWQENNLINWSTRPGCHDVQDRKRKERERVSERGLAWYWGLQVDNSAWCTMHRRLNVTDVPVNSFLFKLLSLISYTLSHTYYQTLSSELLHTSVGTRIYNPELKYIYCISTSYHDSMQVSPDFDSSRNIHLFSATCNRNEP